MKTKMSKTQTMVPPLSVPKSVSVSVSVLETRIGERRRPVVLLPNLDTRQPEKTVRALTLTIPKEPKTDTKSSWTLLFALSKPVVRLVPPPLSIKKASVSSTNVRPDTSESSKESHHASKKQRSKKATKQTSKKGTKPHVQLHQAKTSKSKTTSQPNINVKNKKEKTTQTRVMEHTLPTRNSNQIYDTTYSDYGPQITPPDTPPNQSLTLMLPNAELNSTLPDDSLSSSSSGYEHSSSERRLRSPFQSRRTPATGDSIYIHGPPQSLGRPTNIFARPMPYSTPRTFNSREGNPAAQTNDHWRTWLEVGVRFSGLPSTTTTLDVWEAFSKEGQIATIELYEDALGSRDGRGRVRFRYDAPITISLPPSSSYSLSVRHLLEHSGRLKKSPFTSELFRQWLRLVSISILKDEHS